MDVSHLHSIVDIQSIIDWISISTQAGKDAFVKKCSIWNDDPAKLNSLSYQFASVQSALRSQPGSSSRIQSILKEISEIEPEIQKLVSPASQLEHESSAELLFLHWFFTPLNFIPFLLTIWSYIRVYILPGISLLMPVLMCVLPFILIRYVFHIPMSLDRYLAMMVHIFAGDTSKLTSDAFLSEGFSFIEILKTFFENLQKSPTQAITKLTGVGITIGQSVIQPYLSYKHLSSIHGILNTQENTLARFQSLYDNLSKELKDLGMEFHASPLPPVTCMREHVAHSLIDPVPYKLALQYIGQIDALISLTQKSLTSVEWSKEELPEFILKNTYDIHVAQENRKYFSVNLSNSQRHALLTGPNRGGKSTALRAMCISALLAHTYGCCIGSYAKLTPFTYMFAGLKADDIPGSKSHFEREVEFTANTLQMNKPTLVFIDELFHTTNPPDALESCKCYCKRLWQKENTISVISTHLFDLVDTAATENVQKLCCPATINEKGHVQYKYGLEKGICKVSSVFEILSKYGYSMCA